MLEKLFENKKLVVEASMQFHIKIFALLLLTSYGNLAIFFFIVTGILIYL